MPRRSLPSRQEIPWTELRRRATGLYLVLQAAWAVLSPTERAEIARLLRKSRGRPRNLTRDETRRLGRLAGRAASAAAAHRRLRP
jgi:hypothetical protein